MMQMVRCAEGLEPRRNEYPNERVETKHRQKHYIICVSSPPLHPRVHITLAFLRHEQTQVAGSHQPAFGFITIDVDWRGMIPFLHIGSPELCAFAPGRDGLCPSAVPCDADVTGDEEVENEGYLGPEEEHGGICVS